MAWHTANDGISSNDGGSLQSPPASPTTAVAAEETEIDKLESQLQRQYVEKKLASGLGRIWQDVQTKVRIIVLLCPTYVTDQ
jgi:hypothetical protein